MDSTPTTPADQLPASVTWSRRVLLVLGLVVGVYGAYLLVSRQDVAQWVDAGVWLAVGVVLHDFVLSFAVLGIGFVLAKVVPDVARAPVVVGAVVLGSVTLLAIPMLGRFGERSDNPTLLDRDYTVGWLVVAGIVVVLVVAATVVRARRTAAPSVGTSGPADRSDA